MLWELIIKDTQSIKLVLYKISSVFYFSIWIKERSLSWNKMIFELAFKICAIWVNYFSLNRMGLLFLLAFILFKNLWFFWKGAMLFLYRKLSNDAFKIFMCSFTFHFYFFLIFFPEKWNFLLKLLFPLLNFFIHIIASNLLAGFLLLLLSGPFKIFTKVNFILISGLWELFQKSLFLCILYLFFIGF